MRKLRLRVLPERAPSRRDVLRYFGGAFVATTIPPATIFSTGCNSTPTTPPPQTGFFTDAERAALAALANAVLPPDDKPGGADLGSVAFIENFLTSFDNASATVAPAIYGSGPFSGRAPYANPDGTPSTNFPPESFSTFLFLDKMKDAGWRIQIFGSSAFPQGAPNDALLGPVIGFRDQVKSGLADAINGATANGFGDLATLDAADLAAYFNTVEIDFRNLIIDLVSQACFCPPEYGGNLNLAGWEMCHFEGDQLPLGYSVWSTSQNAYVERADAPMSTAGGPDPEPLSDDVVSFIDELIGAFPTYAKKFS
jgi:hypothetical protein